MFKESENYIIFYKRKLIIKKANLSLSFPNYTMLVSLKLQNFLKLNYDYILYVKKFSSYISYLFTYLLN